MRYKKIVLSIIASVLCLGLLSGCGGYSHDFNSSEEAQKFNSLYWRQDDTYTIIGNRESDLIDSLDIEVKA